MKLNRRSDIILNLLFPVMSGAIIYFPGMRFAGIIRNYIPDLFWAYAFISAILIIWDRIPHRSWLIISAGSFVCFEVAQDAHLIPGTGDFFDIAIYMAGSFGALFTNLFFKKIYQHTLHETEN